MTQGEDAALIATRYLVTFNSGVASGKDYPRAMLNEILDVYSAYYGETHVNSARSSNGVNDIYTKGYDYIEMMNVIDQSLTNTLETLSSKISGDSTFRSSVTGYTFSDLYREYELLQNIEVPKITAKILAGKVTKDRDILLNKYRNRNNDLTISNNASELEIQKIMVVIDSYVQMMSDSGNTNITADYILQDIYDDTQDGRYSKTDQTTSYDKLLTRYVQDRTGYTANEIDAAYNRYILNTFSNAPEESPEDQQQSVTEAIRRLVERINTLYVGMEETTDEYNEYLGAANISVLSSVGVTEKISINKFTVLIVVVFGIFGCLGAVVLGRLWDIIEYYMFTNKTVNLPNRARCDRFIADMESKMLSNSFACIAFRITSLQDENERLGRSAGNQMMKTFARVLTGIFVPSKTVFVAYNDSAQYLVFAEDYNPEQIRASLAHMRTVMAQKCEREAFQIEYDEGYACSGEEQSFYIRRLLSIALRRLSESDRKEEEKPVDAPKTEESAGQQPENEMAAEQAETGEATEQPIETETAEESEQPEKPEAVEEAEQSVETETAEEDEQPEEPEAVEEAEQPVETEAAQENEQPEEPEAVEEAEQSVETEAAEENEQPEKPKTAEEAKTSETAPEKQQWYASFKTPKDKTKKKKQKKKHRKKK